MSDVCLLLSRLQNSRMAVLETQAASVVRYVTCTVQRITIHREDITLIVAHNCCEYLPASWFFIHLMCRVCCYSLMGVLS